MKSIISFKLEAVGFVSHELFEQRMFGSKDQACCAVNRVDARGEDTDLLRAIGQCEIDFGAFRTADPIALHGEHAIGPAAFQLLHGVEQFGSVGSCFEKPLLHGALFHWRRFVTPAAAIHHLFVREHCAAFGAPVEQRFFAIGEAALKHFQEEPLIPAIVRGLAGGQFAAPIEGEAQPLHLRFHVAMFSRVHSRG